MQRSLTARPITKCYPAVCFAADVWQPAASRCTTSPIPGGGALPRRDAGGGGLVHTLMTFLTSILMGLYKQRRGRSMQYGSGEEARMRQSVFQSFVLIAGMAVASMPGAPGWMASCGYCVCRKSSSS